MRYGEQIGFIDHGKFILNNRAWKYLDTSNIEIYNISNEEELDRYLRGETILSNGKEEYILIKYNDEILGLEERK